MVRATSFVILLLSLTFSRAFPASAFVNGSFEKPAAAITIVNAPNGFSGWTVATGSAALTQTSGNLQADAGNQFLLLPTGPIQTSEIDQSLTGLLPNIDYEISYSVCEYNATAAARSCSLEIVLYNQKVDTLDPTVPAFTNTIGTVANPWEYRTFQFTAESTTGALSIENFRSDATNGAYIALDNFAIRVIPKGRPSVAFIGKKPRKPTTKSSYKLRGMCSTTLPLASITVATKRKTITLAGSPSWITKIRLKKGTNRVTVTATDIAGTTSSQIVRTIRRS